jgi:hypothetical protein
MDVDDPTESVYKHDLLTMFDSCILGNSSHENAVNTVVKECRTVVKECRTVVKECRTVVKECRTVDKDCHTVDKDCHTVDKDCHTVDKDCHTVDNDCHTVDNDCHSTYNIIDSLNYFGLVGLYALCYKSDCDGFYSPGNSLDICILLDKLKETFERYIIDDDEYRSIYNSEYGVYSVFDTSYKTLHNVWIY